LWFLARDEGRVAQPGGVVADRSVGPVIASTVAGFLAGIALIAAIGAQNAFVLRQGLALSLVAG
jgi:hypothetical protein